jgi:phosphatidylserine decarboxylase
MDIFESIKSAFSPPHKAGYPFIAGGIVVAFLGLLIWHPLAWLGVIFALFCLYFFRDPERVAPPRANVFLAPADGLVVSIEHAAPPAELGLGDLLRPCVAVVQIAGLIARRILCDVTEGQTLAAGERFGIIRFGSRTDLYLPAGTIPLVAIGQRMIGGETVIADLPPPSL